MNTMITGLCFSGVLTILMFVKYAEAQTVFVVGDDLGWRVPSDNSTYQTWASDKNFTVGDTLLFEFQTGAHNVIEVPEESYTSCSSANSVAVHNTGPVNVTLNGGGQHFYICGIGQHCTRGQKLAINVSGSPSVSPPGATTTPPPPPSSSASTFSPSSFIPFLFLSSLIIIVFYMDGP